MKIRVFTRAKELASSHKQRYLYLTLLLPHLAFAGSTIYVDLEIGVSSCTNYTVDTRTCGAGTDTAYSNFSGAAAAAGPGDVVSIRAGTYNEQLTPQNSGILGNEITYRNYNQESVVITGPLRPAIDFTNRQYIVVEGLEITNVDRWLYLENAHNNVIKGNTFRLATDSGGGSKTGIFLNNATFNKVLNNTLDDNAADSISLVNSDRNVIEGNTFTKAAHALWDIRCGNYNIIRGNYFHNEIQKDGEVYDCDGVAGHNKFNATKRNLIEGNDFAYTPSSGNASPFSGIQYAGQDGIIRRNTFHDTVGPGLRMALYGAEARHNTGNRVYHNVFYGTDFAGVVIAEGDTMIDNIFKNNAFMKSVFVANDIRWNWWVDTVAGKPVQVMAARLDGFEFDTNAFFNALTGEDWLITYGGRSSVWNRQYDIIWWEANYPQLIKNSIELDAAFINEAGRDFHLSATSPLIDIGAFLTRAVTSGSGKVMTVADASYFYDGFGIPGEAGDTIQIDGQSVTAIIVAVDYTNNTLTLDRDLTWTDGQGVSLKFNGTAPDIGVFESGGLANPAPPMPPTDIQIRIH